MTRPAAEASISEPGKLSTRGVNQDVALVVHGREFVVRNEAQEVNVVQSQRFLQDAEAALLSACARNQQGDIE